MRSIRERPAEPRSSANEAEYSTHVTSERVYGDVMRARPRVVTLGVAMALVAIAGCGGGDDASSSDDQPSRSESTDGGAATGDESESDTETESETDTDTDTTGDASGRDLTCGDIFDSAEMDEWFGEPGTSTEETTDSLGQLVCTWETIEDPDDVDDLAVSLVIAQVFSGDPVPAANFIDPDIFEEVTMLEGLGEVAFHTGDGQDFYFYDDPVAGTLSATDIDMGDFDAPPRHSFEEVEALFRTFHERVTD